MVFYHVHVYSSIAQCPCLIVMTLYTAITLTAPLKQASLNPKGSKVTKKTPPPKKKKITGVAQVAPSGKENADSAPVPLQESKQREGGSVERPKKRRRVTFKSSSAFERKKPTLVLTSVQPE